MTDSDKPSWDQLMDEAADWLAGMDTGTADRAAFEKWRDSDPRHAAAFVQVANSLLVLDRAKPGLKENPPQTGAVSRRKLFAGAASVAILGIGASFFAMSQAKATVTTAIGERRTVVLPGGGRLDLNTDSKIQWRNQDDMVDVWLLKGEVAADFTQSRKPCRLYTDDRVAEFGKGTVNARLRGDLLDLSVVSGKCALATGKSKSASRTEIPANHAVLASAQQTVVRPLDSMDTAALAAWPRDELVFQGQTLETAVTEYNRYLTRKIIITDSSIGGIRLGGRYPTHDPQGFLRALHAGFGIRVVDDGIGNIALTK